MKLTSQQLMIVAGVGIFLVAVLVVVFMIVPQFGALGQLDSQMNEAQSRIASAKQLLATRQAAKANAAKTQATLTRLDNEMPDAPELASLIIDLQNTANDAGVEWDNLTPTKPADVNGYQKLTVSFRVWGQWDDIVDYLRRLSELERSARVTIVDLTPREESVTTTTGVQPPPKENLALTLEVYSMPRGAAGAAGGQAPGAPTPTAAAQ